MQERCMLSVSFRPYIYSHIVEVVVVVVVVVVGQTVGSISSLLLPAYYYYLGPFPLHR